MTFYPCSFLQWSSVNMNFAILTPATPTAPSPHRSILANTTLPSRASLYSSIFIWSEISNGLCFYPPRKEKRREKRLIAFVQRRMAAPISNRRFPRAAASDTISAAASAPTASHAPFVRGVSHAPFVRGVRRAPRADSLEGIIQTILRLPGFSWEENLAWSVCVWSVSSIPRHASAGWLMRRSDMNSGTFLMRHWHCLLRVYSREGVSSVFPLSHPVLSILQP